MVRVLDTRQCCRRYADTHKQLITYTHQICGYSNSLPISKYKNTNLSLLLTGSGELKSTQNLPQSIFGDLTFKWRPEEYIACLSLYRPCLQKTEAGRLWDDARVKCEEKRSSQAFPTAFDQRPFI